MSKKLDKLLSDKKVLDGKIVAEKKRIKKTKKIDNRENIIEIKDLFVSFGEIKVLRGVSLNVKKGESLCIVGHNGAGKTVLTETIAGINEHQKGEIKIKPGTEIGFQFQKAEFAGNYTIMDVINFFNSLHNRTSEIELKKMIKIFGLEDLVKSKIEMKKSKLTGKTKAKTVKPKKAAKMSGGQKQRLNLLLALLQKPDVIVLDEFITGLDVVSADDILQYLIEYKKKNNTTYVIISHQPKEIEMLADRVVVMKNGVVTGKYDAVDIYEEFGDFSKFMMEVM